MPYDFNIYHSQVTPSIPDYDTITVALTSDLRDFATRSYVKEFGDTQYLSTRGGTISGSLTVQNTTAPNSLTVVGNVSASGRVNIVGVGTTSPANFATFGEALLTVLGQSSNIGPLMQVATKATTTGFYLNSAGRVTIGANNQIYSAGNNTALYVPSLNVNFGIDCSTPNLPSLGSCFAHGGYCQALGDASYAAGFEAKAYGEVSRAEGAYTIASGIASHAAGTRATAAHDYSYAWGSDATLTNNVSTTRTGQYMVSAPGGMFIPGNVGIGTDSIDNALTIVGDISATGTVYAFGGNSDQWNNVANLSGDWQTAYQQTSANDLVRSNASYESTIIGLSTINNVVSLSLQDYTNLAVKRPETLYIIV